LPPIRTARPEVPAELAAILDRMLAKKPADRFATPAEVVAALEPFTHGADLPLLIGRPSAPRTAFNLGVRVAPKKRPPGRALARGGLLALVVIAAGLFFWLNRERPQGDGGTNSGTPVFRDPPIKVGVLHSLTGTMRISEQPVADATLLAIDEINQQGGVLGRKVEWVSRDGKSDDRVFAEMAAELIEQEKAVTIFGCWTSARR